jgi:hypothetical protein
MTTLRNSVLALVTVACVAVPNPAAPQSEDQKPPPAAEKKPPVRQDKPGSPPVPRREAPRPGIGEERPRSEVPVSFPADI